MGKKKERGNGEGTVYQRADGRWVAMATIGINPATGKLKRKAFYGKTRPEAFKKMNEAIVALDKGTYIEPATITLEKWLNDWLDGRKPHLSEATWNVYEMLIRLHIRPTLGRTKLKDIKTRDIQKLLNEKYSSGRKDGNGGLSPRTVRYIYQAINGALRQAVKERLIPFNPAEHCELPKQEGKEIQVFTMEELEDFFDVAKKKSPFFAAFYLNVSTGLRRGELLGLTWESVNFKDRSIKVVQQLVRSKKDGLIFKELKTQKSKRTVKIDNTAMDILKMHKKMQNEKKLILGPDYSDNNLVFCTENGKPIDPRNFFRHFNWILKKAQLPKARLHDLRHLYATIALENGIDLKTVSTNLGHASIVLTGNTYAHVTNKMQEDMAIKVGAAVANCLKN